MKVTGSLQIRKGTWYTFLRIPTDEGKTRQIAKTTGIKVEGKNARETRANERKANKILDERIKEYEESNRPVFNETLFIDGVNLWLSQFKVKVDTGEIKLNTYEALEIYAKKHIIPYFQQYKNLKIVDVTIDHLNGYIDAMRLKGQKTISIKKHFRVIRGTFDMAVKKGWISIADNPCNRLENFKSLPNEEYVAPVYELEEAQKLLKAIKGSPAESAIMLGLFLGMRKSEVLGLRWEDVDFERNVIHVRNTVVRTSTIVEIERTKSKSSKRDIVLPVVLKNYLLELKEHQSEMRDLFGNCYIDNPHVCQWDDGHMMATEYPYRELQRIARKNGLPKITFHGLRHSCASILFNDGDVSAKEVQSLLGHSSIDVTMDIYTKISQRKKNETSEKMGSLLSQI